MAHDMRTDPPVWFCNNRRRLAHASLYGAGAFYDLRRDGRQATMATDLRPGDRCVVATPTEDGEIQFSWFTFLHDKVKPIKPAEPGVTVRVLFGESIQGMSETMSKTAARGVEPYDYFFNVDGGFKRPSVMKPRRKRRAARSGTGPLRPGAAPERSV